MLLPGSEPPEPGQQDEPLVDPTGTWWDEYLPIYVSMAIPGPLRRGYTSDEVDAMPIPVCGTLMRRGTRLPSLGEQSLDMLAQRVEAERLGLPMPEW